jgi:hypothetical protein
MNPAVLVRIIIYTPVIAGGGIYCWRHGIRWSKNITIKGWPAKVGACLLFVVAALMALSAIFPTQAERMGDAIDKKINSEIQSRR